MPEIPELSRSAVTERRMEQLGELAEEYEQEFGAEDNNEEVQPLKATTAFLVLWIDGSVHLAPANSLVLIDREPTQDEVHGAASVLVKDSVAETAGNIAAQLAAQMVPPANFAFMMERQKEAVDKLQSVRAQQMLAQERR